MKKKLSIKIFVFSFLLYVNCFLSGCGSSGYGIADPYEITGIVSNGDFVSGTVYVLTSKYSGLYQGEIDSDTGVYNVSVTMPDPPYFVWAVLDNNRTLYSYTKGRRNSDEKGITDQNVNINPLTDMVMSLAYRKDTEEKFGDVHTGVSFREVDFDSFNKDLQALFKEVFKKVCLEKNFNLFHDSWELSQDLFEMLNELTVEYINNNDEERTVSLYGNSPLILYGYDLENKKETEKMSPQNAAAIITGDRKLPACVKRQPLY